MLVGRGKWFEEPTLYNGACYRRDICPQIVVSLQTWGSSGLFHGITCPYIYSGKIYSLPSHSWLVGLKAGQWSMFLWISGFVITTHIQVWSHTLLKKSSRWYKNYSSLPMYQHRSLWAHHPNALLVALVPPLNRIHCPDRVRALSTQETGSPSMPVVFK